MTIADQILRDIRAKGVSERDAEARLDLAKRACRLVLDDRLRMSEAATKLTATESEARILALLGAEALGVGDDLHTLLALRGSPDGVVYFKGKPLFDY